MWKEQNKFKFGQRVFYYLSERDRERNEKTTFIVRAIRRNDEGVYEYTGDVIWRPENVLFLKEE